jgi:YVTN family beta-propeller protein
MSNAESTELSSPKIVVRIYDLRGGSAVPPTSRIADRASAELTLPGSADFLATEGDDVWITNRGRMEKLAREQSTPVATVAVPRPCGVPVVAFDSVWVANCSDQSLYRIDCRTNTVVATIPTGLADRSGELSVAAGGGAIWLLTDAAGVLSRIDPRTNTVVTKIDVAPNSYAAAFDMNTNSVWVTNTGARGATGPGAIQRIDPATNKVTATIPVGPRPRFLTAGEFGIWTLNQGDGTVSRIDPKTNQVVATIDAGVPGGGGDIHAGGGRVWVRATRTLLQSIDPATNRIVDVFGPPAGSGAVTVAGDYVWVSAHDVQKVWVIGIR